MVTGDAYPTFHRKKRTAIRDRYEIVLLPGTPAGRYIIEVSLYSTGQGIKCLSLKSVADLVALAQVEVDEHE